MTTPDFSVIDAVNDVNMSPSVREVFISSFLKISLYEYPHVVITYEVKTCVANFLQLHDLFNGKLS